MKAAHYPGRAPIDSYGNGGFRFADMSHRGAILLLPSGIYAWNVVDAAALSPAQFSQIVKEADDIENLLIGTGPEQMPLSAELQRYLIDHSIPVDVMNTGAAVRTYNVLLAERRSVAAALVAVE